MKKLIYIILLLMLHSCIFTFDPLSGSLHIRNNTDEAIYVRFKCGKTDSLPLHPKLELFHFFNFNMEDARGNPIKPHFASPDYRINAYAWGALRIGGTRNNPRLPCKENEITLFFITEKTMRNYSWEEIHKNQMFVKRTVLTAEELESKNWRYIYFPACLSAMQK